MSVLDTLWFEKYRPNKLDDLILDPEVKKRIQNFVDAKAIPHLLLVGSAGIGKTSLAKILIDEVLNCEALTINASDEGGIDTIRTKVKDFASCVSFDGGLKVVVFGEADGLSKAAQDSLKEIIEDCSGTTRFIFTANDISKLSEPIVSRCQRFDIKFSEKSYVKACANVLKTEGVTFVPTDLLKLLRSCYPDFRLAIGEMQSNVIDGAFVLPDKVNISFAGELWEMIKQNPPEEVRAFCINNPSKFSDHCSLMIDLVKHASIHFDISETRKLVLILNEFLVKDSAVVNKEINFFCCLISICELY
jgi:hypothetical protein